MTYTDSEGNTHTVPMGSEVKFVEYYIVGETKNNWIISRYTLDTIPEGEIENGVSVKKSDLRKTFWATEKDIDIHRIRGKIERCNDYKLLKEIDSILS